MTTVDSLYEISNHGSTPRSAHSRESHEASSREGTISPGQSRNIGSTTSTLDLTEANSNKQNAKLRALARSLHAKMCSKHWIETGVPQPLIRSGVFVRKTNNEYTAEPRTTDPGLVAAVKNINYAVVVSMSTDEIDAVFDMIDESMPLLNINGSQIQIYESLDAVAHSAFIQKSQHAALVRKQRVLMVWHNDLEAILLQAADTNERIGGFVADAANSHFGALAAISPSRADSMYTGSIASESVSGSIESYDEAIDSEKYGLDTGNRESLSRPSVYTSAIYVALGVFLMIFLVVGFGNRALMNQIQNDDFYARLGLIASEPVFFCLGLFFVIVVFNNCFQLCGPMDSMITNSRFYSAVAPNLDQARVLGFCPPPITIQMPVYTESLEGVIKPTVASLQAAISDYESRGGKARIFINDDGMSLRSEADNAAFKEFYASNHIGWVARPRHQFSGFVREGKFKKASNMNYALNVSTRVEKVMEKLVDDWWKQDLDVTEEQESELYEDALMQILKSDPRIQAGGNIRMGKIFLLVDSDTVVPEDCLINGAAEMFLSPEVAIIQHHTGVMQVSWDWFENGIAYLTNLVYSSIRFAIGSGETAPFVGHNAFLRWEAVQDVAGPPDSEGYVRFWSDSSVSEDFDMALRLQINGSIIRLASYHGGGFKEGISLSIFDELGRWEKYAYGCSELVFHPFRDWICKGPITPLFRNFLGSNLQLSSKMTIVGYISSYYALASAVPLGLLNYFLIGWKNGRFDEFYVESWKVFIALLVVFNLISNICLAVMRYRLREMGLLASLWENFKWMPFFMVFFGGLPLHLLVAISAHMFGIDMTWGATAKEKSKTSFWTECPRIWRRFKWTFVLMFSMVGVMIYLGCFVSPEKRIAGITSCVPMAVTVAMHILFPIALNPSLMVFNY
ncbi:hypothetical protein OPT61_g8490 [Boeremia exigua]|uniref:Uncharacterized protein n=1 Tax=Boeremia exigua TaxID=749465 RepID=A0ACC2HZ06_9PLEO|nr:hypothetical protein OPT61_g8490 [Boeremia exigua]